MNEENNLINLKDMTTLTGLSWDEAKDELKALLPDVAYKPVPGGADLTDINPGFMIERLTDIFGPVGAGWGYDYDVESLDIYPENRESSKGRQYRAYVTIIKKGVVWYVLTNGKEAHRFTVVSNGGGDNDRPEWSLNGAVTTLISGGVKRLCWQIKVHQGLVTHHNIKQANQQVSQPSKPKKVERPLEPEQLKEMLIRKAEDIASGGDIRLKSNTRGLVVAMLEKFFAGPNATHDRHALTEAIFGQLSSKNLTNEQVLALDAWIKPYKDDDDGDWYGDKMAEKEAVAFVDHLIETEAYLQPQPKLGGTDG